MFGQLVAIATRNGRKANMNQRSERELPAKSDWRPRKQRRRKRQMQKGLESSMASCIGAWYVLIRFIETSVDIFCRPKTQRNIPRTKTATVNALSISSDKKYNTEQSTNVNV
jgi:hypothetical protein